MGEDHTDPSYVVPHPSLRTIGAQLSALQTTVASLLASGLTEDESSVVPGVLAGLSPEEIAAAIPPTVARQVADELSRRLVA